MLRGKILADEWMGLSEMEVKPRWADQLSTNPCLSGHESLVVYLLLLMIHGAVCMAMLMLMLTLMRSSDSHPASYYSI
jgi:hypothetical protein